MLLEGHRPRRQRRCWFLRVVSLAVVELIGLHTQLVHVHFDGWDSFYDSYAKRERVRLVNTKYETLYSGTSIAFHTFHSPPINRAQIYKAEFGISTELIP